MRKFEINPVQIPKTELPTTVYRYFGGKVWLREYILSIIPNTDHWCEAFLGSGCISLALPPFMTEVWNDIDPYLIEFWEQVRTNPYAFETYADYVVASRHLFNKYLSEDPDDLEPLERAWRWWYIQTFSFSGDGRNFIGFPTRGGYWVKHIKNKAAALPSVYERIQYVYFEHYNVNDLMDRLDSRFVAYYDPPYFKEGAQEVYQSMRWKDKKEVEFSHKDFRDKLKKVEHKFILSIDNAKYYDRDDWYCCPVTRRNAFTRKRGPNTHELEYIITNFDPNEEKLLFDSKVGENQGSLSQWL